jgi:hypothetical protein
MVMVPRAGSVSAMVSGIRSPSSLALRMTNCPGLAFLAISGASISLRMMVPSAISSRLTMVNIASSGSKRTSQNTDKKLRGYVDLPWEN